MLRIKHLCGVLFILSLINCIFSVQDSNNIQHEDNKCDVYRKSSVYIHDSMADITLGPGIKLMNFQKLYKHKVEISNNGFTINIDLLKPFFYNRMWKAYDKSLPFVKDGPFGNDIYITEHVHFHWGANSTYGTEHVIDSDKYSIEMHILNRNSKYKSIEEANTKEDGLAVLAILFKVDESNGSSVHAGLNEVIHYLPKISRTNSRKRTGLFFLSDLLDGVNTDKFYYYKGSIAYPHCLGNVTWIVFYSPIYISRTQIIPFTNFMHKNEDTEHKLQVQTVVPEKLWVQRTLLRADN